MRGYMGGWVDGWIEKWIDSALGFNTNSNLCFLDLDFWMEIQIILGDKLSGGNQRPIYFSCHCVQKMCFKKRVCFCYSLAG